MARDQGHAVVAFQKLVVVEAEIGDAVARLNALRQQAGGQPLAALAELGVSEAAGRRRRLRPFCPYRSTPRYRQRIGVSGNFMVASQTM